MAIQWADSFSRYGVATPTGYTPTRQAMLDGLPYAIIRGTSTDGGVGPDPDPNLPPNSPCWKLASGTGNADWQTDNRIALPTPVSGTIGVLARFWFSSLPSSEVTRPAFIQLRTVSGDLLLYLRLAQNGSIQAVGGTTTADTIIPVIAPQSWNHIELKYNCGTGVGEVYINGLKKLDITDGGTGTCALVNHAIRSGTTGIGTTTRMKDYVIWDDTGSENNDVMGTVKVKKLNPVSDVTLGGWVPSTGTTGYDLLAKDAPDDDTYLSADDSPPGPMQFNFENLPDDTTSVRAILSVARMRKIDGGDAYVQMSLSPNGTDWDDGEDRPITSAFSYWFDVSQVSPDTASAWNPQEVNDIIGEIDRTV